MSVFRRAARALSAAGHDVYLYNFNYHFSLYRCATVDRIRFYSWSIARKHGETALYLIDIHTRATVTVCFVW